jgi:uncharacterized membrane protein
MFEIPNPLHPAIVHFPIVLIFLGALLSTLSIFTRRGALPQFTAVALVLAACAAQIAINTGGDQADAVLKRMPEAKPLILVHAEWAEWVRNVTVVAAISAVLALTFYRAAKVRRVLAFITTVIAGAACYCVYQAAAHGGAMVYQHGVGVLPSKVESAPDGSATAGHVASPASAATPPPASESPAKLSATPGG